MPQHVQHDVWTLPPLAILHVTNDGVRLSIPHIPFVFVAPPLVLVFDEA